jgi:uncharacterized protein (TIGR04222 family)
MIELLKEIPGPYFLIIYTIISIIVIFLAKKYAENDYTKNFDVPEPTKIDPLDIALLNRGIKGAIIVSVFNLWRNRKIEIVKVKNNIALKQLSSEFKGLNKLESIILKNSSSQKFYRYFFTQKSIKTIQNILRPNKENLERLKLLPDSEIKKRYWKATLISIFFLLLIGGTKLYLGISRGKPVIFLVLLLLLSVIAVFLLIKPYNIKHSALGKDLIKITSRRFDWLKNKDNSSLMSDDNLLYGIAIFGISAFMGSTLGQVLENPVLLETYAGSSSSYGYGCGGAGCGGGGCGGGCGGCGGS